MQIDVVVQRKRIVAIDSRRSQNQIVKLEMIEIESALAPLIHQMATEIRKKDECSLPKNLSEYLLAFLYSPKIAKP